jgi:ribosome-binding factor A
MGDEGEQQLCLRGLKNSSGFLQSKIAKGIDTRYTPRLTFEIDEGVKKSLEVARILHELAAEREQREAANPDMDASPPDATNLDAINSDSTKDPSASDTFPE